MRVVQLRSPRVRLSMGLLRSVKFVQGIPWFSFVRLISCFWSSMTSTSGHSFRFPLLPWVGMFRCIILRLHPSFKVCIRYDEASCPSGGASPGTHSAPSALSAPRLSENGVVMEPPLHLRWLQFRGSQFH